MVGLKKCMGLVTVYLLSTVLCRTSHRDVVTTQGIVRGYYAPRPPHYAFLGIPYARPPTRYDRFKAPKPPEPWTGIFEAIYRIKCTQPDGSGEENCLVVNVFAPEHAEALPVIVYFHGGGFEKGYQLPIIEDIDRFKTIPTHIENLLPHNLVFESEKMKEEFAKVVKNFHFNGGEFEKGWGAYKGPERLLDQDFVFITFNYRLGVLGYLCLGINEAPGNAGLKDQISALYWVKRNIIQFGGNPSDITVYGTGSGAVSIEILLLSGYTKDLIHKVILESGSILSPSSMSNNPTLDALDLANNLGYDGNTDVGSLIDFYKKLPASKLANGSRVLLPCIENNLESTHSLLDMDPIDILNSEKYQHVSMLIMFTNTEEVSVIIEDIDRFKTVPTHIENLLPHNLVFESEKMKEEVAKVVKNFYFNELQLPDSIIQSYIDYVNDIFIEYPLVKSGAYHAKNSSVFLMKFIYNRNKNRKPNGAALGDIFRYIASNKMLHDYDDFIAKRLITLLSNFIKLGDPTPITTQLIPQIWQPILPHILNGKVILRNIPCLVFGTSMRNELLRGEQFIFWDRIYDKFYINSSQ